MPPLLVLVVSPIAAVIFGHNCRWGHFDEDIDEDAGAGAGRTFCSVPGPLQSVPTAEFWRSYPGFAG